MPKANLYPHGTAYLNWLLLTFHPNTNETRTITLEEALAATLNDPTVIDVGDVTAPILVSATIADASPSYVDLLYNETLNGGSVPAPGDFSIPGKSITGVTISGGIMVRLQVSVPFVLGDAVTVNYTAGTNPIEDIAGNDAANLTGQGVLNNIGGGGDVDAPLLTGAEIILATPNKIALYYNEALNPASLPATSAFSIGGSSNTVTSVDVNFGTQVHLTCSGPFLSTDVITVSYVPPATNKIRDLAGNNAAAFTGFAVTNSLAAAYPHFSSFTAADGTLLEDYSPETGNAWVVAPGTWEIIGNKVQPKPPIAGSTPWQVMATTDTGPTQNYTLTVDATVINMDVYAGVFARMGSGKGLQLLILHGSIYCIDIAAGYTSFAVITLTSSFIERQIKFVFVGNLMTTYINGVLIDADRAFDAANNGTICGILQTNVSTVDCAFSSFKVDDI